LKSPGLISHANARFQPEGRQLVTVSAVSVK